METPEEKLLREAEANRKPLTPDGYRQVLEILDELDNLEAIDPKASLTPLVTKWLREALT